MNDGKPIENAYEYAQIKGEVLLFAINKYYKRFDHTHIMSVHRTGLRLVQIIRISFWLIHISSPLLLGDQEAFRHVYHKLRGSAAILKP